MPPRPPVVSLALFAGFVVLALWVELGDALPGDHWVLRKLDDTIGDSLDGPAVGLGSMTDLIPLALVVIGVSLWLDRQGRRRDVVGFVLIVGVVLVVNPLVKRLIARPRPSIGTSPVSTSSFSFPSGHAASTAAIVGALAMLASSRRHRRLVLTGGIALVVAVGFSRMLIGVHYPSDIIGGWLWVGAWLAYVVPHRSGLSADDG